MKRKIKQKKINIGISTNILPHNNLLEAVNILSTYSNLIEIEIEDDFIITLDDSKKYIDIINFLLELKLSKNLDFSVHSLHRSFSHNLASKDENIRNSFCKTTKKIIDFSCDIGANIVTCHPGYIDTEYLHCSIENLNKSFNELSSYAKRSKINLCLENMGKERKKCLILSPKQHIKLCQETNTWLTLDIVHLLSYLSDINLLEQSLSELLPYTKNIHLADMLFPRHSHLPLGKGSLKISRILQYLSDNKYYDNLVVDATGGSSFTYKDYIKQFCGFFEF